MQIANRHIKGHCLLHAVLLHILICFTECRREICTFRCHSSFCSSRKRTCGNFPAAFAAAATSNAPLTSEKAAEVLDLLARVRSSAKFGTFSLSIQLWGKVKAAKPGEALGHQSLLLNAAFGTRKFIFGQCRFKRHCWSFSILCFPCKEGFIGNIPSVPWERSTMTSALQSVSHTGWKSWHH